MSFRLWFVLALCAVAVVAATAPIGVLTTVGAVRMDNSEVRGNGTVLDGAVIETLTNPTQLNLKNGTRFELSPNTRAKVYDNRLLLEKGASQLHASGNYAVQVNSVSVVPSGPDATVRVLRTGPKSLEVAAVLGHADVRNGQGMLIARVVPGSPLDLQQQPEGAAGPSRVNGKVSKTAAGHYLLSDSTTNTTVELQGNNLDSAVGHCVAATGSADPSAAPAAGATQIIHVTDFKQVACGKKGAVAAGVGGAAAGGAAAGAAAGGAAVGAGLGAVAIGGIVAGTAAGATLGGLAAAGQFSGGKATTASGQ